MSVNGISPHLMLSKCMETHKVRDGEGEKHKKIIATADTHRIHMRSHALN